MNGNMGWARSPSELNRERKALLINKRAPHD
jgi:hypothetical protein